MELTSAHWMLYAWYVGWGSSAEENLVLWSEYYASERLVVFRELAWVMLSSYWGCWATASPHTIAHTMFSACNPAWSSLVSPALPNLHSSQVLYGITFSSCTRKGWLSTLSGAPAALRYHSTQAEWSLHCLPSKLHLKCATIYIARTLEPGRVICTL